MKAIKEFVDKVKKFVDENPQAVAVVALTLFSTFLDPFAGLATGIAVVLTYSIQNPSRK